MSSTAYIIALTIITELATFSAYSDKWQLATVVVTQIQKNHKAYPVCDWQVKNMYIM